MERKEKKIKTYDAMSMEVGLGRGMGFMYFICPYETFKFLEDRFSFKIW